MKGVLRVFFLLVFSCGTASRVCDTFGSYQKALDIYQHLYLLFIENHHQQKASYKW
jgi:hypothetical protein